MEMYYGVAPKRCRCGKALDGKWLCSFCGRAWMQSVEDQDGRHVVVELPPLCDILEGQVMLDDSVAGYPQDKAQAAIRREIAVRMAEQLIDRIEYTEDVSTIDYYTPMRRITGRLRIVPEDFEYGPDDIRR